MDVEYKISKEELVDFHMRHVGETKVFKHQMINNAVFNILVFLLLVFFSKYTLDLIAFTILFLVFMLFRKKIIRYKLRKNFFKIYSFDKYKNLFEDTKLTIIENGLEINTQFVEKIYNWNSIKSIHLVENYIFVRTVNNEDLLIPIFSFKPIENKQIFLDAIVSNTDLELQKQYPKDIKYL